MYYCRGLEDPVIARALLFSLFEVEIPGAGRRNPVVAAVAL